MVDTLNGSSSRALRWLSRSGWAMCGACLVMSAQAAADKRLDKGVAETLYRKLEVFAEVLGQIENHYVDAVSPTDLVYSAVRGMLAALDAHSTFFTPSEYKSLLDATEGEYAGVGIEMDMRDGVPEIISVFADSPAAHAGLRGGDVILAVDGRTTEGQDYDAVEHLLRGPVNSRVTLSVRRQGHGDNVDFAVVRGWVRVAPVEHRSLPGHVTYVQIKTFSRRVAADLAAILDEQPPKGGLVLDLRGNPGGLFDEAVAVCDLFLRDGPIVAVVGRGGALLEKQMAHDLGTQPEYKIAVLIDSGSASAAEIVAGALRDRGRAHLLGVRSYGKGSVQSILDLTDGSGLKLTIARYQTPSGRQIDGHGIAPDEVVPASPGARNDPALDAALTYLRR